MTNGKIIDGRYEIIEEIGRGGMAQVFLAKCLVLNRYVAIKVLRPEYRDDAEFIKRFKIEAQSAASLSHPNIVSIYDVGNEGDMEYIVMEHVEGITLKQYLGAKGTLPWKEAVDSAAQICSGLEHAHKKGIIHKDIKPENIMITKEGILKITDFGIAKALNQGTITTGGLTMGSVHYFSPEQARGGITDAKTDLYSVGILLYEMVAGKRPFEGETAISVAMQHIEAEPVRPSMFNQSIPKSLETVILKAMKKNQSERYQSATEMLIDLKKVYVGSHVAGDEDAPKVKRTVSVPEKKESPDAAGTGVRRAGATGTKTEIKNPKNTKKKKKNDTLSILAGVGTAVVIAAAIFVTWFMTTGSSGEIECPELINTTTEQALNLIAGTDLTIVLDKTNEEITADMEGIITEQDPKSGKGIKGNAIIRVVLGEAPPETEKVPTVSGMLESEAIATLRNKGFDVSVQVETSTEVEAGRAIKTKPEAAAPVPKGSTITLYISSGESEEDAYTMVPSVLGKTEAEAKKILEENNLILGEVQQVASDKEKGVIVKQSEAEGNRVKKGKAIDVRVSNGQGNTTPTPDTPAVTPTPGNNANQN
ncbi:MAG: Stk1 family PASTA domain-containing Ser/Thr kinase [Clostridia bacterium]|nr:Stk1 family PASTA domain-containing Ser/Thr kinase [Clostridia bacterium]